MVRERRTRSPDNLTDLFTPPARSENRTLTVVMCDSGIVRSGKLHRKLRGAQVQGSRSLLTGRRDRRTDCLSAEDSRKQQLDDADDVSRLPASVVVNPLSSDIIARLMEEKKKKHKEALKQLETELKHLNEVCETQVRTVSLEVLSFLQDVDLRLNTLKDRMVHLDQQDHLDPASVQEVCVLWEEVQEEGELRKTQIRELNRKLIESETQRTVKIRVVLRKYVRLLENISFLSPPDLWRLIHTEAMMLNQSLLANRRSVGRLLLVLQEENLQQENLLRRDWEDHLKCWTGSRVTETTDDWRSPVTMEDA